MIASVLAMWAATACLIAFGEWTNAQEKWYVNMTLIALFLSSAATMVTAIYFAARYLP